MNLGLPNAADHGRGEVGMKVEGDAGRDPQVTAEGLKNGMSGDRAGLLFPVMEGAKIGERSHGHHKKSGQPESGEERRSRSAVRLRASQECDEIGRASCRER